MSDFSPGPELAPALTQAVADAFSVEAFRHDAMHLGVVHLYGRFLIETDEAYPLVQGRFQALGYTPIFRQEGERHVIVAMPGNLPTAQPNLRLAVILLAVSILSMLFVSLDWQPERAVWQNLLSGLPFALALSAILLAHELGHYLVARRLGVPVTLPYFIPLPLSPLGTMGAFIQMKAPPQNRRHLLLVAIAGPLAGLVLAVPLLIVGLSLSEVGPVLVEGPYLLEGNSLLYGLFKTLVLGSFVPDCGGSGAFQEVFQAALRGCPPGVGVDVFLHPVAFAAWAGLLVTGLNLIPAGTLDGGHIAYALLGSRARHLTWAIILGMMLLGMVWTGWFLWAGVIFLLGRRSAVPLDDVTRLKPWHVLVAGLMLIIFLLTFSPVPLSVIGG